MKNLLIVGARGRGREVFRDFSKTDEVRDGEMVIKGFLDSNSNALIGFRGNYPPIICSPEDYDIEPDDIFFVALGDPKWRKYYAEMIEKKGGRFYTYISPEAIVFENTIIGEGSYISRWSTISDNVILGNHVAIHTFSVLGHDAVVKDYGTLLSNVFLGGGAEVGECSQMSPKSMIIPHKKIGKNVIVGPGSVVMRNIKDDITVIGIPAKRVDF